MAYATIMSTFWSGTFVVEPRPTQNNALSNLLILSSDSTLDGDRYRAYTSVEEATTDFDDGFLSAGALARVTAAFGQAASPNTLYVGRRNSGSETYAQALTAVAAAGLTFGLIDSDADSGSEATSVDSFAAANLAISIITGAEGAWITGTPPASYPTTSDATAVVYHPTAGQYPATAILARAAGTNADLTRPDFTAPLAGVSTYDLPSTERGYVVANHANPLVPLKDGGTVLYPPPGGIKAMSGEYLYTRFAVMYLTYRWRSAIATQYATFAARNKVWPYLASGEAALRGCLQPTIETGLAVGYFAPNDTLPRGYAISTARAGGVITATVQIGLLDGTTEVVTLTYLERAA